LFRIVPSQRRRRTLAAGQRHRQAHDDADGLVLPDQQGELLHTTVVRGGRHRAREDAARVAAGDAPPDPADVHARAPPRPRAHRAHPVARSAAYLRTAANASDSFAASPPAPWARSALPPPRAPSTGANARTTSFADIPAEIPAAFTAATKLTPFSPGAASTTTAASDCGSRPRTSSARERSSPPPTPDGASAGTTRAAPTTPPSSPTPPP